MDIALTRAKPFARFVMCGAISQYNSGKGERHGLMASRDSHSISLELANMIQNYTMIISMRIQMQGFIVFDFQDRYSDARKELSQWLSEGKIKRKEHIVKGGLGKAEQALVDLFNGANTGKSSYTAHETFVLTRTGKLLVEVAKPKDNQAKL